MEKITRRKWHVPAQPPGWDQKRMREKVRLVRGDFLVEIERLPVQDQRNILRAVQIFSYLPNVNIKSACELVQALGLFLAKQDLAKEEGEQNGS